MDQLIACNAASVAIPCSYIGDINGTEYAMQNDGHHLLAAARELGLEISYAVEADPEGLTGEDLLGARWMDGDWYFVETSRPDEDTFDLVYF